VRDGREALERARAFEPDLVVMDIQMPHVSGLELIEQMKADEGLRPTPIMAVTAYAAKGDEERIRDAGAEGYVSKPISVMRFVEAVRALLEARAQRAKDGGGAEDSAAAMVPSVAEGDAAAAQAVEAAGQSVEVEKEVALEGDAAAARAVEASAGAEEVVAEVVTNAERENDASGDQRDAAGHAGEGRHPDAGDDEEEKLDPGRSLSRATPQAASKGRDDAGPNGETP